ncbi:MAG TPA: hypothetical protein PKA06_08385 [Gemmatales bacterium]|nr:hypothetical protein [Gemmatales bacterium]
MLAGGRQHLDLVVYRRDGFQGEVECTVEGLPEGIQVTSAIIPAGASTGALLLTAPDKLPAWNGVITVLAHATIFGKKITRQARAGCLVWPNPLEQNNNPGISRWCRSTVLATRSGNPALRISLPEAPLALPAGGASNLLVKLERLNPDAKVPVTISPVHLPPGVLFNNNQPLVLAADKAEQEVRLQVPSTVVAEKFPVILRAVAQVPFAKDPASKQKPAVLTSETSNAMVVQVYRQVVKWKNPPATLEITPEQESKLSIDLLREQNYQGPVTVQIQGLPAGVTINSAVIPEKTDQAERSIKATKNAQTKPEGVPIMVRFTGVVNGVNLVTEQSFQLVVKK